MLLSPSQDLGPTECRLCTGKTGQVDVFIPTARSLRSRAQSRTGRETSGVLQKRFARYIQTSNYSLRRRRLDELVASKCKKRSAQPPKILPWGKWTFPVHGHASAVCDASTPSRPPATRAPLQLSGGVAGCRREKRRVGREVPGGSGSPSIRREVEQQPCRSSPVREDASGMG